MNRAVLIAADLSYVFFRCLMVLSALNLEKESICLNKDHITVLQASLPQNG